MPGERDAENLRVALMSYDDRELRIRKFYLEEQSTIIRCTCFQSGEPVLQALRQERCFDVLVLSSQLEDMDSLTFLEKLNRLPSHPPLLLQGDGWADDITFPSAEQAICTASVRYSQLVSGCGSFHSSYRWVQNRSICIEFRPGTPSSPRRRSRRWLCPTPAACAVWSKGWRHGTRWNGSTSRWKTA